MPTIPIPNVRGKGGNNIAQAIGEMLLQQMMNGSKSQSDGELKGLTICNRAVPDGSPEQGHRGLADGSLSQGSPSQGSPSQGSPSQDEMPKQPLALQDWSVGCLGTLHDACGAQAPLAAEQIERMRNEMKKQSVPAEDEAGDEDKAGRKSKAKGKAKPKKKVAKKDKKSKTTATPKDNKDENKMSLADLGKYPGTTKRPPMYYKDATIYTSLALKCWRVKPATASREAKAFQWKKEPQAVWREVVKHVKEL